MRAIAHDYETTGPKPKTCGVVQSAIWIVDMQEDGSWDLVASEVRKHHPGGPIPEGASNVHGIYDRDVADLTDYEENLSETFDQAHDEFRPTHVIGYNSIKFDDVIARRVGMREGLIPVDLMTAAQRMMARGIISRARLVDAYEGIVGKSAVNAHDAEADLLMTMELIQPCMKLAGIETVGAFVEWLRMPYANPDMLMPFGKHRGLKISELPKRYLDWMVNRATDIDGDLRASAEAMLDEEGVHVS